MSAPLLSGLYIYPVKSLAGIQVTQWPVLAKGFKYDRQWMLVDQEYQFMTQRKTPKMGLITTQITEHLLILSASGYSDIAVPLSPSEVAKKSTPVIVKIWHDHCLACLVNQEVDQWLSAFLETPCHLIYQPETTIRNVDLGYATPEDKVNFSDGFPFLILSQASLDKLNQVMGLGFSMQRFRPNLVIDNCLSFAEDYWREITIGEIAFRLPKACSRCAITTIEPGTENFGKEPLTTLNRIRKWQKNVYFGQNALHNNQGYLQQGDHLSITKTGPAQPPISSYRP